MNQLQSFIYWAWCLNDRTRQQHRNYVRVYVLDIYICIWVCVVVGVGRGVSEYKSNQNGSAVQSWRGIFCLMWFHDNIDNIYIQTRDADIKVLFAGR